MDALYANAYTAGHEAGSKYPWPAEWRELYKDKGHRTVRGHGRMLPAEVAGWMRGFRHACMGRAS